MTIQELEERFKKECLESVYVEGVLKKYISGNKIYSNGIQENRLNVYGIYKIDVNKYYVFMTDDERGINEYSYICSTEEEACDDLYEFISRKKIIYDQKIASSQLIKSIDAYKTIQDTVIEGVKIPHSTSRPVIRKENDKYYLAVYVFYYTREDVESNKVNRPTTWAIADISTGEIVETRNSREYEFSDASYDIKYDITPDKNYDISKEYYEKAYAILDKVRRQIIKEGTLNRKKYDEYLNMILENIPENYKRFYLDLSI